MRTALVLAVVLVARTVQAQPAPDAPPPPAAPASPAAPQVPLPATPVDPNAPPPAPAPTPESAPPPRADPAYGEGKEGMGTGEPSQRHNVVIRYIPERSRNNIIMLAAIGGAAVVFGAGGLYYHLQSRSSSDEVSAHRYTGEAWTPDRQATFDDAHDQATIAKVLYGIGGGLALAAAVAYIVTEPEMTETVVAPHVTPIRGGAMVGGGWSF